MLQIMNKTPKIFHTKLIKLMIIQSCKLRSKQKESKIII